MKLLLTGDPGSGKSYTIETICELAQIMQVGFVGITSYNGIAAANVDGTTVCSMFSIGNTGEGVRNTTLSKEVIQNMALKLDIENIIFLILDEVSTIDSCIHRKKRSVGWYKSFTVRKIRGPSVIGEMVK